MAKVKNLEGQRFGRLVVIRMTAKKVGTGNVVWRCRCDCGRTVDVASTSLVRGRSRSCGCLKKELAKGPTNPNWNGGVKKKRRGYIAILCPDHPDADGQGYVLEHRLVMERILGRRLKRREVVHHIDGNPANNSPENLILFPNNIEHMAHHNTAEKECLTARGEIKPPRPGRGRDGAQT